MLRSLIFLTGFFVLSTGYAYAQIDLALKKELDSILVVDQYYRKLTSGNLSGKADSLAKAYNVTKEALIPHLWQLQTQVDSINLKRVEEIIADRGYPGKTLVGTPTNNAAFFVIQHSQLIDKYLPLIKEAAEKEELPFPLYAMMLDRSLMYSNKEQIYGTQAKGFEVVDPKTGEKIMKMVIWPIKDAAHVNERRKGAGFDHSVEENAKRMGIDYKAYSIKEVNEMQGQ